MEVLGQANFSYIYVLHLSAPKCYIGSTNSLDTMIEEHKKGTHSCDWVQSNLPIVCITVYISSSPYAKDAVTNAMMNKRGVENVQVESMTEPYKMFRYSEPESVRQTNFSYIYVLHLSNSKYYVGATNSLDSRIEQHKNGIRSCDWVQSNLPIANVSIYISTSKYDEDGITKEMMSHYGVENVRGGSYTQKVIPSIIVSQLKKELATANNACFECGGSGHYSSSCPNKKGFNVCSRCHRKGHTVDKCYAKTTVEGAYITTPSIPSVQFHDKDQPHYILCNTAPCPVVYKNKQYPTAEHAYQCQKFLGPCSTDRSRQYAEIMRTTDNVNELLILSDQKEVGGYRWRTDLNPTMNEFQDVKVRTDWDDVSNPLMRDIVMAKFQQNEKARSDLLATGTALLEYTSPNDSHWGTGKDGLGKNRLGIILSDVRKQLS